MLFWLVLGEYIFLAAVDVALVVAAFKTSVKLGLMALFLPFYVASFGNHRLRTQRRRDLAILWWAAFVCYIATLAMS
jgi:hypothetical protein